MRIALASILLFTVQLSGQNADKVSFHVTSVQRGDATDYCTTGKCSATRFTVEGYTQDKDGGVQYVLECVEVLPNEPGQHSVSCFRVHAHADYMVRIFAESVAFGHNQSPEHDSVEVDYNITSEKEIKKK
jgi:hypothetical protein